jgi:hypothetical protein
MPAGGRARCQVSTLIRTRRAEWERRSCVAEEFEPRCLGILARHQVYVTIIKSMVPQMKKRRNGACAPILLSDKNEMLCPLPSRPAYVVTAGNR